jgi:uncharacterized protein YecE (DUF72 family)
MRIPATSPERFFPLWEDCPYEIQPINKTNGKELSHHKNVKNGEIKKDAFSPTFIGTAGWSLPKALQASFPEQGTYLQRYSRVLNCVEINSSFYREHKPETYFKWAASTPDKFLFSVKLSRYFTQKMRLKESGSELQEVLLGIAHLGKKWGVLLVQLPPSLEFESQHARKFLSELRRHYAGPVVWEPRHFSWSSTVALGLLKDYAVSKVLADPEACKISTSQRPLVENIRYYRLHGTPEIYKSKYSDERIRRLANKIQKPLSLPEQTWCIFDNTTFGWATENALALHSICDGFRENQPSISQ